MDRVAHLGDFLTSTDATTPRVAVIGGGYAGMAAAVSLAEHGVRSTVLEAGKVLGGRARRIEYRGEVLDNGQHILSGAYSELLRLMALTGTPPGAVSRIPLTFSLPPHFSLRAPQWIAPLHLAWALLTANGLALSERVAAIRFMQALKRKKFMVDASDTVESLLARHSQPDKLIHYLWQPLTISALNTPVATASAQVFVNVLRDALASSREASDLLLPRADLSELFPNAASTWLATRGSNVRLGVRVKAVSAEQQSFCLDTDTGEMDNCKFDAVILAIGPHQFESISLPAECIPKTEFNYEPIVTVYLKFATRVRLAEPMFGQTEGLAQWFFDRRQLSADSGQNPSDGLIAAVISASGPHEDCSQEELANLVVAELSRHTGPLPAPEWHKVITEKFATFACTPNLQRQRPHATTNAPGVFLAGDYTAGDYPATLEGAARSGISAAGLVTTYLSLPRKS